MLTLSALIPSACGGDSDTKGDGGSPKGGEAGDAGEGGTDSTGGTRPTGGAGAGPTGGRGGSSGSAGRGGSSGDAGSAGEAGGGGVGASGGEAGAGGGLAGEGGAGGAPECPFAIDAGVTGTIKITTDDNFILYLNGALIDETPRLWNSPQTYTVNYVFRHPSRKNVIAVHGINNAEIDGLDRGVIVDLSFDAGAGLQSVLSDATWKLSTTLLKGWFQVAFDDSAWVAATDEGAHGIAPYGNILGTSSARWLWSYDSNVPAASKPTTEEVWVRKVFYVSAAGTVSATPSACP